MDRSAHNRRPTTAAPHASDTPEAAYIRARRGEEAAKRSTTLPRVRGSCRAQGARLKGPRQLHPDDHNRPMTTPNPDFHEILAPDLRDPLLMIAARNDERPMVGLPGEAGADVDRAAPRPADARGRTAADVARRQGLAQVAAILQEATPTPD